jgi:hypothetical protein
MEYHLNKKDIAYHAAGDKAHGDERILLHSAIDLTLGTPWSERGFIVAPLVEENLFRAFEIQIKNLLRSLWKTSGLAIADDFQPDQYHTVATTQELHLAALEKTKFLPISSFPIPISAIENRVAEICGMPVIAKNPFDNQSVFHFRVVRPGSNDNNPLHRDVWLEDYTNCINLYIPVAGSNELSSLTIIPGSHHWPENKIERTLQGAMISGMKFNVPAVTSINGEFEIVRPDPKRNEVLVFSPYLIHGGAVNLTHDQTRISIELRLWKNQE